MSATAEEQIASNATLPPITTSTSAQSSSTCLDCIHFSSCFGYTQEVDLDKLPVLQEVDNFFKGHGVGDFTFSRGKLLFDEDVGTGELRYVQMAVTTYNTSIPVEKRYEQGNKGSSSILIADDTATFTRKQQHGKYGSYIKADKEDRHD
ncbi:hypothetical protein ABZP36_002012 [Zizania latifolia]